MKRLLAAVIALTLIFGSASAQVCWVMCDGYVNVRARPGKGSMSVGFLDACDDFETDGTVRNGFVLAQNVGEGGDNWIFAGYVSSEKPEAVNGRYVCTARTRAACRRWINGPRISGKAGWIYCGSNVRVYYRTSEWSVTNRGYIRSEWLEEDPE